MTGASNTILDIIRRTLVDIVPIGNRSGVAGAIILDTFADTNGVLLTNHTPDISPGGGWAGDAWDIQSNKAESPQSFNTPELVQIDAGESDVDIQVTWTTANPALGVEGIVARYVDDNNHWIIVFSSTTSVWAIVSRVSSTFTTHASTPFTPLATTSYALRCVLIGTSITATIDGGMSINFSSSSHQSATKHGLRGQDKSNPPTTRANFNDFTVKGA